MAETTNPAVIRAVVDCLSKMGAECIVADCPNKKFNLSHLNTVYIETGMLNMANSTKCELNKDLRIDEEELYKLNKKELIFLSPLYKKKNLNLLLQLMEEKNEQYH